MTGSRSNNPQTDHDLLIEVSANVKNMSNNINQYNINNSTLFTDHEARLRLLRTDVDALISESSIQQRNIKTSIAILGVILTIVSITVALIGISITSVHK